MTTVSVTPYLAGAAEAELEDWGPLAEATGQEMKTAGVKMWQDGDAEAGIWETTAGPSYWKLETHEVIALVAGSMTVTADGEEPQLMKAGDVAVFPRGWQGVWDVHETLRKVYAIF